MRAPCLPYVMGFSFVICRGWQCPTGSNQRETWNTVETVKLSHHSKHTPLTLPSVAGVLWSTVITTKETWAGWLQCACVCICIQMSDTTEKYIGLAVITGEGRVQQLHWRSPTPVLRRNFIRARLCWWLSEIFQELKEAVAAPRRGYWIQLPSHQRPTVVGDILSHDVSCRLKRTAGQLMAPSKELVDSLFYLVLQLSLEGFWCCFWKVWELST